MSADVRGTTERFGGAAKIAARLPRKKPAAPMHRALGTVALLLAVALVLPTLAAWAQAAVPVLVALLVFLAVLQLLLPPSRGS